MHTDQGRPRGFTIIELLTVIAILAILMAMLTSALAGARKTSQKARELNNIRQVGVAWQVYSNTNADAALPGYIDPFVQVEWDVEYDFPDGAEIPPVLAASWTFRLLTLLDNSHEIVHGYADEDDSDPLGWALDLSPTGEAWALSNQPAFGYNALHVGGWWEMTEMGSSSIPRYRYYDATADIDDDGTIGPSERTNVVSRSASTIRRTTQLVVFCSSAEMPPGSTYDKVRRDVAGAHWVAAPWIEEEQQWRILAPQRTDTVVEVVEASPSPIGRYTGNAAILFADGHNSTALPGSLADQRSFIDVADRPDWTYK